ncbi:MAG: PQQ-binding-like beta-propeller repeat protein, partial [Holophagales bacterium]|nr:PQQ-binding-like beta-propeller repeat protein [Holophagales bacterium]
MVSPTMQASVRLTLRLVFVCGLASGSGSAQPGATDGDWRTYAGDTWASKYSPLDQIDADNFGDLEIAWRWKTADTHLVLADESGASLVPSRVVFDRVAEEQPDLWLRRPGFGAMTSTPLAIEGVLYLITSVEQAAAIDGRTGETIWVHDPRTYESSALPTSRGHRGAAYWEGDGEARIVWGTGAGYLIAVDARTGVPAADFGDNGRVDFVADLPRSPRGQPFQLPVGSRSAAPLIVGDTIVLGTNHTDFIMSREAVPGFIFAHDVRTGERLWEFHIVPQSADEFGADTWEDESWRTTGNGNAWANLSADPELGYVYVPTSAVSPDHYGGHRLGDNLFSNSIVCLDIETGERVWHYQLIRHEVWD